MSTFGNRLKNLRKSRKLTQKGLADLFSLGESTISMYERDEREPSFAITKKLADYFEVDTDYLLGRTSKPTYKQPDDKINVSFRDGGEDLTEEEAEYLEQQLKQFREWRKRFQQEDK